MKHKTISQVAVVHLHDLIMQLGLSHGRADSQFWLSSLLSSCFRDNPEWSVGELPTREQKYLLTLQCTYEITAEQIPTSKSLSCGSYDLPSDWTTYTTAWLQWIHGRDPSVQQLARRCIVVLHVPLATSTGSCVQRYTCMLQRLATLTAERSVGADQAPYIRRIRQRNAQVHRSRYSSQLIFSNAGNSRLVSIPHVG